ncbi:hypothetical protein [Neotamlana laminarinivorans]|uniref:Uncharacterized protein n=1 Tax=Neotamlana laminarinivorans TaxID=2883124 RepID=A0A9X1I581_9FLAO|nr:hypothetical protein [Tamlana laminarinivorans]MCB4800214.1 hypothetical protein [Tamlana laminarinivorans]
MEEDFCFRCGANLLFSLDSNNIFSSEYEKCGQGYAKEKGRTLIDSRKNSSFAIPLYSIIFEKGKVSNQKINQIASTYLEYDKRYIKVLIEDIDEELTNPKRKLTNFHNMIGTEEIARDYLKRLSIEIKNRLK